MRKAPKPFQKGNQSSGKGGRRSRQNPRPNDGFGPKAATNAPVAAFRAFWREWLMTKEVVDYIKEAALSYQYDEKGNRTGPSSTAVALLGKLIDKCHPTPQSIKVQEDGARPIRLLLGQDGQAIRLPYLEHLETTPIILPGGNGRGEVH